MSATRHRLELERAHPVTKVYGDWMAHTLALRRFRGAGHHPELRVDDTVIGLLERDGGETANGFAELLVQVHSIEARSGQIVRSTQWVVSLRPDLTAVFGRVKDNEGSGDILFDNTRLMEPVDVADLI